MGAAASAACEAGVDIFAGFLDLCILFVADIFAARGHGCKWLAIS